MTLKLALNNLDMQKNLYQALQIHMLSLNFATPASIILKEIAIYESEVSDLGNILQAHVESAISNFGNAISQIEKRQILINILKN